MELHVSLSPISHGPANEAAHEAGWLVILGSLSDALLGEGNQRAEEKAQPLVCAADFEPPQRCQRGTAAAAEIGQAGRAFLSLYHRSSRSFSFSGSCEAPAGEEEKAAAKVVARRVREEGCVVAQQEDCFLLCFRRRGRGGREGKSRPGVWREARWKEGGLEGTGLGLAYAITWPSRRWPLILPIGSPTFSQWLLVPASVGLLHGGSPPHPQLLSDQGSRAK